MKRTLQNLSMLLLMIVIGMGSSWAQDEVVLLTENFDAAKVGDNTSTSGSGQSITAADFETLSESDKLYQAGGAVKIGTGSASGSFTTIALDLSQNEGNYIVEFDVKGWTNVEGDIIVTPSNGKAQTVKYSAVRTDANFETISLPFNGGEEATTIKIATSAKRAFIDNLKIYYKPSETQKITTSIVHPTAANSNGVINAELGMEDPFFGIFVINTADDSRIENPVLTYSSSNENVATIDENGDITLVGAGETTITAKFAGDDTYYGSTGSYILKVTDPDAVPVNSFEEAFATATSTAADILFQFENVQVVGVNGNQVLVQDQEGNGAVIYQANHGFVAGNELNGTVNCKYLTYGVGFLEFTGVSSSDVKVTNANEVTATPHTIGDLELINYGSLITIEGLTYTGNNVFTDATGASITMYNTFKISDFSDISLEEGEEYTVTGAYVLYGTTKEFAPRSTSDIVKTSIDDRIETYLTFDGVDYEDDEPVVYNELGEDFNAPTATLWDIEDNEIAGVVLNYESSDPDVAEVTPNGIMINGEGTAVITVSYDGSDVYQPCQQTYTIIVTANGGDEKQYPTYNVSGLESVTTNGEFPFNVETRASGLKVELEKTKLAELIPGTVVGEYTLKTYGSEGDIILNISTEEDATYYANEEPYNVHISFGQGGEEPQPTYNTVTWTLQNDQSTVSDDYAEWTHKDVKLTYEKNQSNTPVSQGVNADYGHTRFYANTTVSIVPSDGVEIAYVTFTTTGGKNVSADQPVDNGSVEVDGTAVKLTPTDGTKAMVLVMANQVRATDMTVYYTGEGTAPVEPTEVTINVTNEDGAPMDEKIVMTVGETKNFMVYASNQAPVTYSGDNDEVATVEVAATFDGGIITAKAAGTMTITFTVDATSNQPSAEKKITVTVVDNTEPQFEIEDGVFDFTAGVDYGSGRKTGAVKVQSDVWTAGNVTLTTDGRNAWGASEKTPDFRLYPVSNDAAAGSIAIEVPKGFVITSIAFTGNNLNNMYTETGTYEGDEWTGIAQSVTFTASARTDLYTITVTYKEGTVPVEPTEVTIDVMNEDGTPMDEKIVMNVGETKNFMVYASNQAPVTYSGDNDEVATVEAAAAFDGGIITAKAAGTMTITFTVAATAATEEQGSVDVEKKITVTVVEPQQPDLAGLTAETAFTVEEAIAAIKAGVDANTDYYVKGLISKVDEIATETYSNATYWLADDMGADNQMLEVYRGKAFRGDGFNEGNASLVTVGNEVVVKGNLTYYEKYDVYEFSSNSQLVSVKFDFLTVKSGDHGTICLPYDATVEGATVYEVAGVVKDDADNLSDLVLTEHEGNLLAGVPYVYKATADNIAVTYLASAIVTYGYGATGLQGTLAETPQKVEAGNYILYNNVLRKVGDDADAKIAKYHAYFDLTNVATFNPENTAGVKYISISFDEDATGITELTEKTESTEGAIYNLQGQRVNSLQRGINIVGGKKVLVK